MISSCSPIKPNEAIEMKKTKYITLLLLVMSLLAIPCVLAQPQSAEWYKDTAVDNFLTDNPEYDAYEASKWSVWVISPLYVSPKNHRNVMIEYTGEYELVWTGHVWEDRSGVETVNYESTYEPEPNKSSKTYGSINLQTAPVNWWDGSNWKWNPAAIIGLRGLNKMYPYDLTLDVYNQDGEPVFTRTWSITRNMSGCTVRLDHSLDPVSCVWSVNGNAYKTSPLY